METTEKIVTDALIEEKDGLPERLRVEEYLKIARRRWLPASLTFVGIIAASLAIAFVKVPMYESRSVILAEVDPSSKILGLDFEPGSQLSPIFLRGNPILTQIEILQSVSLAEQVIQKLDLLDSDGQPLDAEIFLESLEVNNVALSDVIEITYKSSDPREAANVTNTLVDIFIENTIRQNMERVSFARDLLANELPRLANELERKEQNLQSFREANRVVSLDSELTTLVDSLAIIDRQIFQAEAEISSIEAVANQLREQIQVDPEQGKLLITLAESSGIQQLLREYQDVQSKLVIEQTRYEADYPTVLALQDKANALLNLLNQRVEEIANTQGDSKQIDMGLLQINTLEQSQIKDLLAAEVDIDSNRRRLASLVQSRARFTSRSDRLPEIRQIEFQLERELTIAQKSYEDTVQRLREAEIAAPKNTSNVRVVSKALVPEEPASPNKKIYLGAGVILGGFLAAMTALISDLWDKEIKNKRDLVEILAYPILADLSHKDLFKTSSLNKSNGLNSEKLNSMLPPEIAKVYNIINAKALNQITKNLNDMGKIIFAVANSVVEESKFEAVLGMGIAAAKSGKKTLIVDADLLTEGRHVHVLPEGKRGLSDIVIEGKSLDSVTYNLDLNLDFVPAGNYKDQAILTMDERRVNQELDDISSRYDVIIINSPPVVQAYMNGNFNIFTRNIVLVSHLGILDFSSAMQTKKAVEALALNVLGLITIEPI